ncbi:MAG TPA: riboflavin synthase [Pseudomonadota bacterium]|nr:riboflavin synthase [Xanthomonadales bacterium]HQW81360.1 riboflavin synthase [Pseudomonadota bacterium]
MFTGLVEATGRVAALIAQGGDVRLRIDSDALGLDDVLLGDSIAVNGVCLTVVTFDAQGFEADVSTETLSRTTLGSWTVGRRINLEKSLRFGDRVGGHLVSGHVDGVGRVVSIEADVRATRWRFAVPRTLSRFIAEKGSVAVDGVSLTVNAVADEHFEVALIPHTQTVTAFSDTGVGSGVNLEVDLLARYLDRLNSGPR